MVYLPFKNPVIDIATDTILNQTFQYIHSYIKCNISTYILNKYFTSDRFLPTFVLIAMYSHICGNKSHSSSGITCKIHGLNQDNQLMSVFLSIRFVGALCLDRNMHMLLIYVSYSPIWGMHWKQTIIKRMRQHIILANTNVLPKLFYDIQQYKLVCLQLCLEWCVYHI